MTIPEFTVDSRLRMHKESVKGHPELVNKLIEACTHPNPAYATWLIYKHGYPPKKTITSAKKEKDGSVSFPRGAIERLSSLIGDNAIVHDKRIAVVAPLVEWKGKKARVYQRRAIEDGKSKKKLRKWVAGIWRAPQGSGKTHSILELISELGLKTLVVCPNTGVFNQWVTRARSDLGVEPGIIKGKTKKIGDLVTIAMQKTLWVADLSEIANEFGAVIFDEAQFFGSKTYQEVIDKFPAIFRLAVSGDERRADGLEFLIYDQFGKVEIEISREEVKQEGGIVDVEVILVPTSYRAEWYRKLKSKDKFVMRGELVGQISKDEYRNNRILELALETWNVEKEQVAILASRREHCQFLNDKLDESHSSVLLIGGDKDFEVNRSRFANHESIFAVGTFQAIGVGFESHPELARGIFASPVAASSQGEMAFRQFLGRYSRPAKDKHNAKIYYMFDRHVFGTRPAKLIKKWVGDDKVTVLENGNLVPIKEWLKKNKD